MRKDLPEAVVAVEGEVEEEEEEVVAEVVEEVVSYFGFLIRFCSHA